MKRKFFLRLVAGVLAAIVLTLRGEAIAAVPVKVVTETVEYLVKTYGDDVLREGTETVAEQVTKVATKYGDEGLDAVRKLAASEGSQVVAVCAAIEAEISQLEDADRADFLKDLGLDEPGLNRVIRAGYTLLGLQTYFTAGPKEVRAWTVRKGATAPQAAGVIHTDFERGFIRAEVIAFEDYLALKGEQGAKEAGKLRLEGKEYIVREGDVMHFRFNV